MHKIFLFHLFFTFSFFSNALAQKLTPPQALKQSDQILLAYAHQLTHRAFIPGERSQFRVGSILIFASGRYTEGANVKMPCGLTQCAERIALYHALTNGKGEPSDVLRRIYVSNHKKKNSFPCGICLQTLSLMSDEKTEVIYHNDAGKLTRVPLKKLLPLPYISRDFRMMHAQRK